MIRNKKYRIAVITNSTDKPSISDLIRLAKEYELTFEVVNFPYLEITNFESSSFVKKLLTFDVVYYRTGLRGTFLPHLVKILNEANIPIINGDLEQKNLQRKIQQAFWCGQFDIAHPKSIVAFKTSYEDIAKELGPVFVVKPDLGSKGENINLIKNQKDFEIANKKQTLSNRLIYQELISEAEEYRVYTLGPTAVASYKKIPGADDFRANLHVGGSVASIAPEVEPLINSFAANVAAKLKIDISGIDILVKDGKCYLLETNQQPGWENLSQLTGVNLCKLTLQFILDTAHTYHAQG